MENKQFFDLKKLPSDVERELRDLAHDMLGFDPWQQEHTDWMWFRRSDNERDTRPVPQRRVPLHTAIGFQIGLQFLSQLMGFVPKDEVGVHADTYSLVFYSRESVQAGARTGWYVKHLRYNETHSDYYPLPLEERLDTEPPERVLFSALKYAIVLKRKV